MDPSLKILVRFLKDLAGLFLLLCVRSCMDLCMDPYRSFNIPQEKKKTGHKDNLRILQESLEWYVHDLVKIFVGIL